MNCLQRNTSDGFTLMEMLVVLAIIALTAAIALPSINTKKREIDIASASIENLLAEARLSAISKHVVADVTFEKAAKSFVGFDRKHAVQLGPDVSAIIVTGKREDGLPRFSFLPDGTSSGGEISLQQGQTVRTIQISWLSGKILLKDPSK
jgi:general secretion pathway protein H